MADKMVISPSLILSYPVKLGGRQALGFAS